MDYGSSKLFRVVVVLPFVGNVMKEEYRRASSKISLVRGFLSQVLSLAMSLASFWIHH